MLIRLELLSIKHYGFNVNNCTTSKISMTEEITIILHFLIAFYILLKRYGRISQWNRNVDVNFSLWA